MTDYDNQNWHRNADGEVLKTTVRLSSPEYDNLHAWAQSHSITEALEVVALTFGFSKHFTVIGNLSQELSHPESINILSAWITNPFIAQLSKLRGLYEVSPDIHRKYPSMPHAGNANQTKKKLRDLGADIGKKHFLLCLMINPLAADCSEEQYHLRRALRVWLIVQSLERASNRHCLSDKGTQKLASYLTQDTYHKNWLIIDRTLERAKRLIGVQPFTFDRFTLALRNAAAELQVQSEDISAKRFLVSLAQVAEGYCEPFELEAWSSLPCESVSYFFNRDRLPRTQQIGEFSYQSFDLLCEHSADIDDDAEPALLYSVDPDDTPEKQRLTGQSILLQTTELSHYLPWSWDKVLPPEVAALEAWLGCMLVSPNLLDRLGAAVVWLATRLSRSLPFVLEFSISSVSEDEWALSPDFAIAHRQSPSRHNSWAPDESTQSWIEPFEQNLALQIPEVVQQALHAAASDTQEFTRSLHELWHQLSTEEPSAWFTQHAKNHFPRLTSAKLANIQPQKIVNHSGDHSLARLSSAHPRAALPAACGYANWDIKAVESGFNLPLKGTTEASGSRVNLLGSLLAPLESLLIDQISQATETLDKTRSDGIIVYHNTLARYCVMALYAATGCRHLTDPFESITHFCADPPSVFINDKADEGLHNGRLVPLPKTALQLVTLYQAHLAHLANAVEPIRPSFAAEITRLREKPSSKLPLFFLLDDTAHWHSVTDSKIPGKGLFRWPLPPNLFRHRYAQKLAREGVHPEVIDGWMGHAERGVGTYSDQSARCWLSDYKTYQQTVNDVFDQLGFRLTTASSPQPAFSETLEHEDSGYQEPQLFGAEKRRQNRVLASERAEQAANDDLDLFLGPKALEELDEDQIQQISNLMLLRENGLPHPNAATRYAVMIDRLDSLGASQSSGIRRRMTAIENERSLLTDRSPAALATKTKLDKWVQQTKRAIDKANVSKSEALILAAAFLAIDKYLAYPDLLEDVVKGVHYRLIQHKKRFYFEYNEDLDHESYSQPVQRHEIDYKTATLLSYGKGIKSKIDLNKPLSSVRLQSLSDILQKTAACPQTEKNTGTTKWLFRELATLINQASLIQLPGAVSAALSGRQPPTSCSLVDYFRLSDGVSYQLPDTPAAEIPAITAQALALPVLKIGSTDKDHLYASAKAFFQDIRDLLKNYTKATARETADVIERFTSKRKTDVSSAVLHVGYWLADRIKRGKGRQHTSYNAYAAATAERYLNALSEPFQGLAYEVNLSALDEEDITSLCSDMIILKRNNRTELDYFGARLQEFFRWASERGIAEPIWEDLDLGSKRRSVRPGLFSGDEYQRCLQLILNSTSSSSDQALLIAFVLILAFRFGLRAQEAIGLQRADWCESGELNWVLVRNNEYRELKRPSSRRAVPLMFPLSDREQSTIESVLSRHDSLAGHTPRAPILCAIVNGKLDITPLGQYNISSAISQSLKQVTGNPMMTLHHARHSFYNILGSVLFGLELPLTQKLTGHLMPDQIRTVILGQNDSSTRRSAMALARAMGHATPNTGFKSYNRLITEWADNLTPVRNIRVRTIPNAIQIHEWAIQKLQSDDTDFPLLPTQLPTPRNIAQALRLRALGYCYNRTEAVLQLRPGSLKSLDWLVDRVNRRHRFKVFDVAKQKIVQEYGDKHPNLLLEKITPDAWVRLIDQTARFPRHDDLQQAALLPSIEHVPALVGRNGQLLMSKPEHCELIKLVLELFQLPEGSYGVFARKNHFQVKERLTQHGFKVFPVTETDTGEKPQLDTFSIYQSDSRKLERQYGGVIFSRSFGGCIHNSHELVIALLIAAASYGLSKTEPPDAYRI
ncbi:hypothetical protein SAMN04488490_0325 [Marinobacter sp. LV10R510-11A]|uniref:site-specific integrase n=1 Tax=Marinobacter sp. LV10R510-11A TaxID=1415568 RepID=UPI000BB846BF|nr:site-specific integrase [Marinobacter sp. LV10R510-11A]SOB74791.1 hypothetical protein SAMN04488490_0325 [Marinobacter sp. LV10R510-11A]